MIVHYLQTLFRKMIMSTFLPLMRDIHHHSQFHCLSATPSHILTSLTPLSGLPYFLFSHTHTHTRIHTHTHTHTHTYIHTYTYTHTQHTYTHPYMHTHTFMHTHTYIHIHTHTYTHIHTHCCVPTCSV